MLPTEWRWLQQQAGIGAIAIHLFFEGHAKSIGND